MQVTTNDVVVYTYNLGVVLSSAWAIQTLITGERLLLIAASTVLALAWTVYFWISIAPRIGVERGAPLGEDDDSHAGPGGPGGPGAPDDPSDRTTRDNEHDR